ncbi:MAG: hypothetical protein GC190_16530 [Alphaproteobacteria bacterium]|nr:hypothetical protein [Alphaproteobacteria bacterium]
MTLTDVASLSTAISGFAVTISLVYLALQVHQNTKHTRALIHQGRVAGIRELVIASATPEIASVIVGETNPNHTPEDVKRYQFGQWCAASFYGWQDSFAQHRRGLLDEDIFLQMRAAVTKALATPAIRAEWDTKIRIPGTAFAAFVDQLAATLPTPAGAGSDIPH